MFLNKSYIKLYIKLLYVIRWWDLYLQKLIRSWLFSKSISFLKKTNCVYNPKSKPLDCSLDIFGPIKKDTKKEKYWKRNYNLYIYFLITISLFYYFDFLDKKRLVIYFPRALAMLATRYTTTWYMLFFGSIHVLNKRAIANKYLPQTSDLIRFCQN